MRLIAWVIIVSALNCFTAQAEPNAPTDPQAGSWRTWVIASGREFRTGPPPDRTTTDKELDQLAQLAVTRDGATLDRIAYWDSGGPSYRWSELAVAQHLKNGQPWQIAARDLALMHIAIYDAMVATWDSKYAYGRPRPSSVRSELKTAIADPAYPSYPSAYAVAAGAASEVLAYLYPDQAAFFRDKAAEAGQSRLAAGVNYPSDVAEGVALGRRVAALVIERGRTDGTDAKWAGSVPPGPCLWNGVNPVLPLAGTWKPWVLSSASEFRPGPPPPCDSAAKMTELSEIKNFKRTPLTNNAAMFWEAAAGGLRAHQYWNEQLSEKVLEYRLGTDPPRAARAFVLPFVTLYDAGIACWDGKFAYWAIRPFQLDADVKTVVPTPNHPSYPAAHACSSIAVTRVLGYLFPRDAETFAALGEQAAESRIWAGIHYRSDIDAGRQLAIGVASKVITRARQDGAD